MRTFSESSKLNDATFILLSDILRLVFACNPDNKFSAALITLKINLNDYFKSFYILIKIHNTTYCQNFVFYKVLK